MSSSGTADAGTTLRDVNQPVAPPRLRPRTTRPRPREARRLHARNVTGLDELHLK